jgi:hypothetical protein
MNAIELSTLEQQAQSLANAEANAEAAIHARYAGLVEAARGALQDMYGCALDEHADAMVRALAELENVNNAK